jgi:hypothetical protein
MASKAFCSQENTKVIHVKNKVGWRFNCTECIYIKIEDSFYQKMRESSGLHIICGTLYWLLKNKIYLFKIKKKRFSNFKDRKTTVFSLSFFLYTLLPHLFYLRIFIMHLSLLHTWRLQFLSFPSINKSTNLITRVWFIIHLPHISVCTSF